MEDVSQVVLIGDAGGNTNEEVKLRRTHKGEGFWNRNKFPQTTTDKELASLIRKKVPIYSFLV